VDDLYKDAKPLQSAKPSQQVRVNVAIIGLARFMDLIEQKIQFLINVEQ
jgi:hypothetical protein